MTAGGGRGRVPGGVVSGPAMAVMGWGEAGSWRMRWLLVSVRVMWVGGARAGLGGESRVAVGAGRVSAEWPWVPVPATVVMRLVAAVIWRMRWLAVSAR